MSKGLGRTQRRIIDFLAAHDDRYCTLDEIVFGLHPEVRKKDFVYRKHKQAAIYRSIQRLKKRGVYIATRRKRQTEVRRKLVFRLYRKLADPSIKPRYTKPLPPIKLLSTD